MQSAFLTPLDDMITESSPPLPCGTFPGHSFCGDKSSCAMETCHLAQVEGVANQNDVGGCVCVEEDLLS